MWRDDLLAGFQQRSVPLADDDAGPALATVVRARGAGKGSARHAVLYLHGWNSYFHHEQLAEFFGAAGVAFYALDLRRYGRSLRPTDVAGFVSDLTRYDEEIAAAEAIIREEQPECRLALIGHSTGGLVASLWAARHPKRLDALVLISPWLETQGSSPVRAVATPMVRSLSRLDPMTVLPQVDPGFYGRTLHRDLGGSWDYLLAWQPSPQFPVRAGWLAAILAGHAQVAAGLRLRPPVLTLLAERSHLSPRWSEDMRTSDIVIEVGVTAQRAAHLGNCVTIVRIAGAMHDIPLSAAPAREAMYRELDRWLRAYFFAR